MLIINEKKDIADINPVSLRDFLLDYFLSIAESMEESEDFSLEEYGPLYLLEPDDDPADLPESGVSDLFQAIPEWVERISLPEGEYIQIAILCNNEFMEVFFLPPAVAEKMADWIQEWI